MTEVRVAITGLLNGPALLGLLRIHRAQRMQLVTESGQGVALEGDTGALVDELLRLAIFATTLQGLAEQRPTLQGPQLITGAEHLFELALEHFPRKETP